MNCPFCDIQMTDMILYDLCPTCRTVHLSSEKVPRVAGISFQPAMFEMFKTWVKPVKLRVEGIQVPAKFQDKVVTDGYNCCAIREMDIFKLKDLLSDTMAHCSNPPNMIVVQYPMVDSVNIESSVCGVSGFDWLISESGIVKLAELAGFSVRSDKRQFIIFERLVN